MLYLSAYTSTLFLTAGNNNNNNNLNNIILRKLQSYILILAHLLPQPAISLEAEFSIEFPL